MITERLPFDPCLKVYWDFEDVTKDFPTVKNLGDRLELPSLSNGSYSTVLYEIRQFKDELYTEDTYYRFIRIK